MNGGGQWRLLKCAGDMHDKTIIDRIMLRFRPIAPKPMTGDSISCDSLGGNRNSIITGKRKKRKYVRVSKNNDRNKEYRRNKGISYHGTEDGPTSKVMTLQLVPEKADLDGTDGVRCVPGNQEPPTCLSLKMKIPAADDGMAVSRFTDQAVVMPNRRVVESWVTVVSVTGTCMDDETLGRTDVEKMKNLERDTCPGFISDGLNEVVWVNGAYKNMVTGSTEEDGREQPPETVVWLAMTKEGGHSLYVNHAFSCQVRLQYSCHKERHYSKMVPCDVWRMDCGGFAWRLDVKTALSLGL
ncbi:hypothetical protein SLEP1_g19608 [Rubroshorea leprosula]|uniref:DUF7950 domain-containing protein n=1 Tax=Rubroshorea leprosula TaxID=152421 RepID=A0AAV5JAK5_9ROSI|nr:hypothetical protein SLEP1_g19608 [Rubroshorea leprosula]